MFEDRIAKSFQSRRGLLRGAFPAAYEFLVELEERKPPVIWLNAGKSAQIYWQDAYLCTVHFVGIGEANTGIRLGPEGGKLVEGTEDRSHLFFAGGLADLVDRHGGVRNRWATLRDGGEVELRHPAPGVFFRDLMGLLQTTGARDRADRLAAELESELAASEQAAAPSSRSSSTSMAAAMPSSRPSSELPAAAPASERTADVVAPASRTTRPSSQIAAAAVAAAERDAAKASAAAAGLAPAAEAVPEPAARATPPIRQTDPVRKLRPTDTHRLIGFEHLVDAYVAVAAHPDPADPRHQAARRRLDALERVFLCRLPHLDEIRGPRTADRAQVIALCWRCLDLATRIESPFLAPPREADDTMLGDLWEDHGEALGTPIEALRKACRETVKSALCSLFPGIEETVVSEADLEAAS